MNGAFLQSNTSAAEQNLPRFFAPGNVNTVRENSQFWPAYSRPRHTAIAFIGPTKALCKFLFHAALIAAILVISAINTNAQDLESSAPGKATVESKSELVPLSKRLKIFPNPVIDQVTITVAGMPRKGIAKYDLMDILGSPIKSGVLKREGNSSSRTVDMKNLNAGIYFLKVHSEAGSHTSRLVKK